MLNAAKTPKAGFPVTARKRSCMKVMFSQVSGWGDSIKWIMGSWDGSYSSITPPSRKGEVGYSVLMGTCSNLLSWTPTIPRNIWWWKLKLESTWLPISRRIYFIGMFYVRIKLHWLAKNLDQSQTNYSYPCNKQAALLGLWFLLRVRSAFGLDLLICGNSRTTTVCFGGLCLFVRRGQVGVLLVFCTWQGVQLLPTRDIKSIAFSYFVLDLSNQMN